MYQARLLLTKKRQLGGVIDGLGEGDALFLKRQAEIRRRKQMWPLMSDAAPGSPDH